MATATTHGDPNALLLPYVPRLAIEWMFGEPSVPALALPGSMVFVDISGFTKMSERLARRGKIGAEEVTDVMNTTFSGLLEIAYRFGGGLVKFGGDALLLFFRGADHAPRAVRAAASMRARLRETGRIATSAGNVTLRMSVGVHTGDFHFFLTGRSHRELIVTGPAASRTVEMEQAAEAGDVLLSPECASAVPARNRGAAKGPGVLLRGMPAAPEGHDFGEPPLGGFDLADCVPLGIRAHLLSGIREPEHRVASVAFVHFDGTDALIEDRGMETVAASIDELVHVAQAAADEHGVTFLATDIDHDGGKIILVAGVPSARGEDEERLLRAVRAVADAGCSLPVRIGVNRGRIFAADVGAAYRRTFTVMGDTVNLAARLMARAAPGRIIATPEVLDRSHTTFKTTPLEPFVVKGKTAPITAFEVGEISGTRAEPGRRLAFVGRERELAIVESAVEEIRAGRGHVIELVGEGGLGKTRLVGEIRARAADLAFHQASSEPYAVSTPYFTFRGLLRELLDVTPAPDPAAMSKQLAERIGALRPELVPWIPLVAVPLDVAVEPTPQADAIDPSFRKARTHDVVSDLLAALLPGPTLLVFEDAYWMDDASRELLLGIESRRPDLPWLVCITRRPHTPGFSPDRGMPATTIKLEPLGQSEAATLAAAASGDATLPPQRLAALAHRAGGNPLFLQELVAAAATDPSMESLPDSIEALVTARIDTLDPADRTLLRYAAVLGSRFTHQYVAAVLAGDGIDADPDAWRRLGDFISAEAEGRYRFEHALYRDVAYEGLPFRRRRLLHRRAGEFLEERGDAPRFAELLSLHFHRATIYDKSWRYSRMAGDGARAKYANLEAAEFYRRALEAARRLTSAPPIEMAQVAEALGDVSEMAGLYDEANAAYRDARRLTRAGGLNRPELLIKEGVLRERAGRYSDALRWYARGIRTLRQTGAGNGTAIKLSLAAAGVRLRQGRFDECVSLCEDVVRSAPEPPQLAHAYYLLHLAHTSMGSAERARYRELALPIYERLGDLLGQANVLNNLGIDAYYEGRWDEAMSLYRRSREARERIGDAIGAGQLDNNIAEILLDQGRLDEAESLFRTVLAVFRASGYRLGTALVRAHLARIAARRGGVEHAEAELADTIGEWERMSADSFVLQGQAWLAECLTVAGDSARAARAAEDAIALARGTAGSALLLSTLHRAMGYAHAQQGRYALAQDSIDESIRAARQAGAAYEEALGHHAWARLSERSGTPHPDAHTHDAEARAIFARLGVVATAGVPL